MTSLFEYASQFPDDRQAVAFVKAGPVDEARDAQGRWTATGLHAEARNFFGRLGSSVKSGWAGLSDAEKAAAYVAIAGAAGFVVTRGANRLPLMLHAHLADWMNAASKYFATPAPIGHAASAAAATHVGAKLLEGGFPHAANRVHGLAMTLGAAAAAATHPKVRDFLSKTAAALGDTVMTRMVGTAGAVGKTFVPARSNLGHGGIFHHIDAPNMAINAFDNMSASAWQLPNGSMSGAPFADAMAASRQFLTGQNLSDYRKALVAERRRASDEFHQRRSPSAFASSSTLAHGRKR